MKKSVIPALVAGLMGVAGSAVAAPTYLGSFAKTECNGFQTCYATQTGTNDNGPLPSWSIIKVDNGGGGDTNTTKYPNISGNELSVTPQAGNVLDILYSPGAGDPTAHYVVVKQANGFALFYDASPITAFTVDLDTYFPKNPGWSHVTVFNGSSVVPPPTPPIPEPASLALFGLGLAGLGAAMRRRRAA